MRSSFLLLAVHCSQVLEATHASLLCDHHKQITAQMFVLLQTCRHASLQTLSVPAQIKYPCRFLCHESLWFFSYFFFLSSLSFFWASSSIRSSLVSSACCSQQYCAVKYTKAQPLVEDGRMWRCMPGMCANLTWFDMWTHVHVFESFQLDGFLYRGITV